MEKEIKPTETPRYDPHATLANYRIPSRGLLIGENAQFDQPNNDKLSIFWSTNGESYKTKDLNELKSLIIVGTQSTGKTTFLHQIITSLLVTNHPAQLKFILADIKGIEFNIYSHLDKHFIAKLPKKTAIISDAEELEVSLNALCTELDNRYELFKSANERNLADYNQKFIERKVDLNVKHRFLPYLILVIDDLNSFTLFKKDEILMPLNRIVLEGYRAGILTVIATSQFAGHSASGSLLSSIGHRIAFNLFNIDDYKKIFETVKLERHLEPGEYLFKEGKSISKAKTILNDFSIVEKIVQSIYAQGGFATPYNLPENVNNDLADLEEFFKNDPLLEDAARVIVQNQIGSTSLLQRRMKLGYNRAGRLMDLLEAVGVVGPNAGSTAREVLIKTEEELIAHLQNLPS